ncbi:MAG: hypothetical protein GY946_22135 [bacterium]|nr:hypothetical protein [bacterium]
MRRSPDPKPEVTGRYAESKRSAQDHARGFGYIDTVFEEGDCTGSMTAGGLSSLVVVHDLLKKVPKKLKNKAHRAEVKKYLKETEQSVWDAIAWLSANYTVEENPGSGKNGMWKPSEWHYYYLYGLERACVLAGKRYLAKSDWYADGAELLVDAQKEAGQWQPQARSMPLVDTCFALLFLKRAALRTDGPKRPVITGTPGERLDPTKPGADGK